MLNNPNKVILHCSDTPDYPQDHERWDSIDAETIDRWHKERGFDQIGYHYVIKKSGTIEVGRSEDVIGAHCRGHNTGSLGVCIIGRYKFTKEQIKSLTWLQKEIEATHGIEPRDWFAHYEFDDKKTCPKISGHFVRTFLENGIRT